MDIKNKHVAVLVYNYFEQSEFEEPIKALSSAGAKVTVVGAEQLELTGFNHVEVGSKFKADILLEAANPEDYDALVVPGGVINADKLRTNLIAQEWVLEFLDSGKPLAIICHAPWVLISADAVDGRRLTSYFSIRDDIINAGGYWVDLPVVVDGNLITSRQPADLPYFNDSLIKMLAEGISDDSDLVGPDVVNISHRVRLKSFGKDKVDYDDLDRHAQLDLLAEETMKSMHRSSSMEAEAEDTY